MNSGRIIDMHQDLALSYTHDPDQFIDFDLASYTSDHPTNAGSYQHYIDAGIQTIWAVIWPYQIIGNLEDKQNRHITYSQDTFTTLLAIYKKRSDHPQIGLIDTDNTKKKNLTFLLHLEGCDSINSIDDCQQLYDQGIRSLGFVRNFANSLSGCNLDDRGLTNLGKQVIERANTNNVIIDTAHMNHRSMMETIAISNKPVINSHSNLKAFGSHTRNVEDDFIKLLAEKGGVLGLSICRSFLSDTIEQATIEHYCKQIQHCIDQGGKECVAFGSDYHGLTHNDIISDIQQINTLERLYDAVVNTFGSHYAHKFFVGNAQRIIDHII